MLNFIKPSQGRMQRILADMKKHKSYLGFLNKGLILNDMAVQALQANEEVTYTTGGKGTTYRVTVTPLDTSGVPKAKSC